MAFDRLQELGEERFTKILNLVMRGETAMTVARMVQQPPPKGWGVFQDIAEGTLRQQILRLKKAAARGMFGVKAAARIESGAKPQIKLLEHVSVRVIERLEELADAERTRVFHLIEKEQAPDAKLGNFATTNEVIEGYRKTLLDVQKLRFDMGLDEFKGPVAGSAGMHFRGASQTTVLPDGASVQKQVFEAVTSIEQIFEARKIPHLIANE